MHDQPVRPRAYFYLLVNILLWAIGPLFVKHFTVYYDSWTQNGFRYACGATFLLVLVLGMRGTGIFRLNRGQWKRHGTVALVNVGLQVPYAIQFYFIYPSVAVLIHRTNIILVVVLACLFFPDERGVARSRYFQAGSLLALFGVILVVTGQDPALLDRLSVTRGDFWIGVSLALVYALGLASYAVVIKRAVRDVPPDVSFTHVSWMTALMLGGLMLLFGRPSALWLAPVDNGVIHPLWLMAGSALLCISIAHVAIYAALREIKAIVSISLGQLTPVVTCGLSAMIYGDVLAPRQIAGGALVLLGAWLVGVAQTRVGRLGIPPCNRRARAIE